MKVQDYVQYDALGLAELVRSGEVTSQRLRALSNEVSAKVNPVLNAIANFVPDELITEKGWVNYEGKFAGVPFMFKDTPPMAANVVANNGSRFLKGLTNDHDHSLMKKCREAGLCGIATTTVPEFSANGTTESILYGKTRNPWNTDYSVGGSSGGSAVVVASGMVPIAHGGDGGGSIRFPAAALGLVGLRPTRGRFANGPDRGEGFSGCSTQGFLTKSVRDTAASLDEMGGPDIGCYAYAPLPNKPYLETMNKAPGRLRIAWADQMNSDKPAVPEVLRVLDETVSLLKSLGHDVVKAQPDIDWDEFNWGFDVINAPWQTVSIDSLAKKLNRNPSDDNLENSTLQMYEHGKEFSAYQFVQGLNIQNLVSRTMGYFFENYDLLLTPTMADLPAPIGKLYPVTKESREYMAFYGQYTSLFNMTGLPAISLPLGWSKNEDLPIGMHIAGRFGDEETILKVSRQLELIRPWKYKHLELYERLLG